MSTTQSSPATATPKRVIRIADVIQMLHDGKDRDQIKTELGLTSAEAKVLFAHKDVAKKKVRKPIEIGIEIVGLEGEDEDCVVADSPQEEVVSPQTPVELPEVSEQEATPVVSEPQASLPASFMDAFNTPATPAAPATAPATSGWD